MRALTNVTALVLLVLPAASASAEVLPGAVEYDVHASGVGWLGWQPDGATAGSVGKGRSLEAVKIRLTGELAGSYDIEYQCHLAGTGWGGWSQGGERCGTEGQARALEAIKVRLVPRTDDGPEARVAYRAHSAKVGWGRWVADGAVAGTTGKGLAMEALEIRIESVAPPPASWIAVDDALQYSVYAAGVGWTGWQRDGATAGTVGQSRAVEALRIQLRPGVRRFDLDLRYRGHLAGVGDTGWSAEGERLGTEEQGRALEAVAIEIGGAQGRLRIAYRTHSANVGWGPWVYDGAWAGTKGKGLAIEAIEIRIERRGR